MKYKRKHETENYEEYVEAWRRFVVEMKGGNNA